MLALVGPMEELRTTSDCEGRNYKEGVIVIILCCGVLINTNYKEGVIVIVGLF